MLSSLGEFILMQCSRLLQTRSSHSRAGQLDWIMFCSETSDISTSTNESLLSSGSSSIRAKLSGIWQRANLTMCSEEENLNMEVGGEGIDEGHLRGTATLFLMNYGNM